MNNKQPILFITFKRPFETLQVLNKILEYKPEKIYISSDAGRDQKEQLVIFVSVILLKPFLRNSKKR